MSVTFTEADGAFVPATPQKLMTMPQQRRRRAGRTTCRPTISDSSRIKNENTSERAEINVVLNWFEELKKTSPGEVTLPAFDVQPF